MVGALAKLSEPRGRALFARSRVSKQLDAAATRRLVWVTAPAGAGKTTAVQSWFAARRIPRLWYRVDRGDADAANLFHYLARGAEGALPALSLETSLDAFARRFFEALFASGPRRRALVFDDYQEAGGGLDDALLAAVAAARPGLVIVVCSRTEPPTRLARAFASDDAALIDWETLRMTAAEARGVARVLAGRGGAPARAVVDALHELSAGWPVGLALLLAHPDVAELSELAGDAIGQRLRESDGAQRMFDYLASEIFDREDEATRRFLLRSAVLPVMTERQARELTGVARARAILHRLQRGRLLVTSRGGPVHVYGYHPLFRAFLLDRAESGLGSEALGELRRRAGTMLVDDGQLEAGFDLLQQARDWPGCAQLIARAAPALVAAGRRLTLASWLAAVPADVVHASPWLVYWKATCGLGFTPLASAQLLGDAFARFRADGDLVGANLAWSGRVAACVHAGTDLSPIDGWLEELAALDGDAACAHPAVSVGRLLALFRRPGHARAAAWVREAFDGWRGISDPSLRGMTAALLVPIFCFSGQLGRAATVLDLLRRGEGAAAGAVDLDPVTEITLCNGEAVFAWATADNAACLAAVERGLALAAATGIVVWNDQLAALGAAAGLATGDLEVARPFLERMRDAAGAGTSFTVGNYHYYAGWDAMLRGEVPRAAAAIDVAITRADAFGYPVAQVTSRLAGASARARSGGDPAELLAAARALADASGSPFLRWSCALADACVTAADAAIAEAFALGRALGVYNVFWWLREPMAAICARALEAGIEVAYVTELVRRHRLAPPAVICAAWPYPIQLRALGRLEILVDGAPLALAKKSPQVPLRLLAAIVALGGRDVAEARLVEALWPDADGASGRTVLHTTLHRLRKLLGRDDALRFHAGAVELDPAVVSLDVWLLERAWVRLDHALERGPAVAADVARRTTELLAVYAGPLLGDDDALACVAAARTRMHEHVLRSILAAGRYWESRGELETARALYERALERDDASEPLYQRLMTCLERSGQAAEALRLYERCERALASQRGLGPSRTTRELREKIHRQHAL